MFNSRLLKQATKTFTKEDFHQVLDAYSEWINDVDLGERVPNPYGFEKVGFHGPLVNFEVLVAWLERQGVSFGERKSVDLEDEGLDLSGLKKHVIFVFVDSFLEVTSTDHPLPEFEDGDGMAIYGRLGFFETLEAEIGEELDGLHKPSVSILDLDEDELIERLNRKQ